MSQVAKFYELASNDDAMLARIFDDAGDNRDKALDNVMSLAAEQGFNFSRAEADAWLREQGEQRDASELTDNQLEDVAGGKGGKKKKATKYDGGILF